jgi:hypothetical protein
MTHLFRTPEQPKIENINSQRCDIAGLYVLEEIVNCTKTRKGGQMSDMMHVPEIKLEI